MPSLNDCPIELLDAVSDAISSTSDLINLRATNSKFRDLITRKVFTTHHVCNTTRSVTAMMKIQQTEHLAKHVKAVIFRWIDGPLEVDIQRGQLKDDITTAFRNLNFLPFLEVLHLNFYDGAADTHLVTDQQGITIPDEPDSVYLLLQLSLLGAIARNPYMPRLKCLALNNIIPFGFEDDEVYGSPGFLRLMEVQTHLSISVHRNCLDTVHAEHIWDRFWGMIPTRFLMPSQRSLTSLSLFSDQPISLDLSGIHYPHLQSISFSGIIFDSQQIAERFIVRHRATLRSLVLDSCPMLAGAAPRPARRWAVVCKRFEEALSKLVDLQVLLREGWGMNEREAHPSIELTYELFDSTGYMYDRGRDCISIIPDWGMMRNEDGMALGKLMDTVAARRRAQSLRARHVQHRDLSYVEA